MTYSDPSHSDLLLLAIRQAYYAGKAILNIYKSCDFEVQMKGDNSPITLADRKSHSLIIEGLKKTGIPLLSEESTGITWVERKKWKQYWLIDPLDGTKEFINRNDEFTVNIALIEDGQPTMGIIYLPVYRLIYFAAKGMGSYRISDSIIKDTCCDLRLLYRKATKLPVKTFSANVRIVASRSHLSEETKRFISDLEKKYEHVETVPAGSSLKLCLIAEGKAEIYPRFGPTMEWDIAAGHMIVTEAGGSLKQRDGSPFLYNKPDLLNPWFIARSQSFN